MFFLLVLQISQKKQVVRPFPDSSEPGNLPKTLLLRTTCMGWRV